MITNLLCFFAFLIGVLKIIYPKFFCLHFWEWNGDKKNLVCEKCGKNFPKIIYDKEKINKEG